MENAMDSSKTHTRPGDTAERVKREREDRSLRNRILLYLGGFEISGVASLELAAECIRRAAPDPTPEEAMRLLNELLRERGLAIPHAESPPLIRSFPSMKRRPMISGRMESLTLYGSCKKMIRNVLRSPAPQD